MHSFRHIRNFSLYLFLFFTNFQELKFLGVDFFSIPKLTALLYVLTLLPQLKDFIHIAKIKLLLIPIWIFFLLLTLVSLFNIKEISFIFFDFGLFQNILLFWFLLNHSRREPLVLEKAMLSLAFGSAFLAILYKAGIGIEFSDDGRITMFGDNQNIIGLRMTISITILAFSVLQNTLQINKLRYFLLTPIPIMLELLAVTASRVALISFVLCVISGIFLFKTRKAWIKIVAFSIGFVVFVFIYRFFMQYETLILRLLQSYEGGDLAGRGEIYETVIPVIIANPIFGIGKTGYSYLFGDMSPHNVFLEVLSYTGSIGLLFYLFFLFIIFKIAVKTRNASGNILPFLLLIPVAGFLLSGQILTQKLGWIIFAYIGGCSVNLLMKKDKRNLTNLRSY